jgi:hypothetical protein
MPPVRFSVVRTRRRGRKLSDRDLHQQIPIIGAVECFMFEDPHLRRTVRIAKLTTRHDATRPELIPSLYDAQVTTLGPIGATNPMRKIAFVAIVALFASHAVFAANPACEAQANEKKLSGAARTSFVTKCEKDVMGAAQKTCDAQAAERKLSGAAKTSFTKKCVTDATTAK